MRTVPRTLAAIGTALLLAVSSSIWSPFSAVAEAASSSGTRTTSMSSSGTFYSKDIKRCIVVTLSGTVKADWTIKDIYDPYTGIRGTIYGLSNLRLLNPKMKAKVYNNCGSKKKAAKLSKIRMSQAYYSNKCDANISVGLSVGTGFSISLGVTPSCGTVKLAKRVSSNTDDASTYTQSNTGTTVTWPDARAGGKDGTLCARPVVSLRAYVTVKDKAKDDGGSLTISGGCVTHPA